MFNTNNFLNLVLDLLREKQKKGYDLKDTIKDLEEMREKEIT